MRFKMCVCVAHPLTTSERGKREYVRESKCVSVCERERERVRELKFVSVPRPFATRERESIRES